MTIRLDYRRPAADTVWVGVYINGSYTGELRIQQADVVTLQLVLQHGLSMPSDSFLSSGDPGEWVAKPQGA